MPFRPGRYVRELREAKRALRRSISQRPELATRYRYTVSPMTATMATSQSAASIAFAGPPENSPDMNGIARDRNTNRKNATNTPNATLTPTENGEECAHGAALS